MAQHDARGGGRSESTGGGRRRSGSRRDPGGGPPGPRGPQSTDGTAGERRRRLSQNFFASRRDAAAFAGQLSVPAPERVVELGAGSGQITEVLARAGHPVTALEIDPYWARQVERRALPGVEVINTDILKWRPQHAPVVLVGNLPFGAGTQILRHVLELGPDALREGVFLLQREYVGKRTGRWGGNLMNVQWEPWFDFAEGMVFGRETFRPVPRTDGGTLLVRPRRPALLEWSWRQPFQSFAATVFGTGHMTIGEAARKVLPGHAGLSRARVDPDTPLSALTREQWQVLFEVSSQQKAPTRRPAPRSGPRRSN